MADVIYKTKKTYVCNGSQVNFTFAIDYLRKTFIKVMVDSVNLVYLTDYIVEGQEILLTTAPTVGAILVTSRDTPTERLVAWVDASVLRATDLTLFEVQLLHLAEEGEDRAVENEQFQQEQIDRSFKLAVGSNVDPVLPSPVPLKSFRWNSTGTALELTIDPSTILEDTIQQQMLATASKDVAVSAKDASEAFKESAENSATMALTVLEDSMRKEYGVINVKYPPIPMIGAKVDGITNDSPAFQAIHDYCVNHLIHCNLFIPKGSCKLNTGLNINSYYVGIIGDATFFDCRSIVSGDIFYITGDTIINTARPVKEYSGFLIQGNGRATNTTTALALGQVSGGGSSSFVEFNKVTVEACHTSLDIRNNGYLARFNMCGFGGANIGYLQSGGSNAGEAITFRNCSFVGNLMAVQSDSDSTDMYFSTCSFDFNTALFNLSGKVRAELRGCHFESDNYTAIPIILSGEAYLSIIGGFIVNSSVPLTTNYFVKNDCIGVGGFYMIDVLCYGTITASGYLATGVGRNVVKGLKGQSYSYLTSRSENSLFDGTFDTMSNGSHAFLDDWFITQDTTAITNKYIGSNHSIVASWNGSCIDGDPVGGICLQNSKEGIAGTPSEFTLILPIPKNCLCGFRGWYKKNGECYGSFRVSQGFCTITELTSSTIKIKNYVEPPYSYGVYTLSVTSLAEWQQIVPTYPPIPSPSWATHMCVKVDTTNMGVGNILFDDFIGNFL